eukprot:XP_008671461.1 endoplasmin homolog [Zea mays]
MLENIFDYRCRVLMPLEFQAEVSKPMDIIINSLYSNKDIYVRELIANASNALGKIRFLSLADKEVLGEEDTEKLEIHIKLDNKKQMLSIRDMVSMLEVTDADNGSRNCMNVKRTVKGFSNAGFAETGIILEDWGSPRLPSALQLHAIEEV